MAAANGCSIRWAAEAPARRAASLTARRSTEVMADGTQMSTRVRLNLLTPARRKSKPDHALGDVEVGDGALAQGTLGHDVTGGPTDHLPGLVADGQHFVRPRVERDHRGLVEDDAVASGVDQGVRRAQVDGEVTRHCRHRRTLSEASRGGGGGRTLATASPRAMPAPGVSSVTFGRGRRRSWVWRRPRRRQFGHQRWRLDARVDPSGRPALASPVGSALRAATARPPETTSAVSRVAASDAVGPRPG